MPVVAYRILTPRLILRCWSPADAPLLQDAVNASIEHLRPWMPWVENEPTGLAAKVALLRRFRGQFDLDQDYVYGIFDRAETTVLGGTGLHTRLGPDAREIGYWIHGEHINQGLAREAAAALTKVAFELAEMRRVEIHCDPANIRSAAVPRKLGFVHEATLRQRSQGGSEPRDAMIWTLLASEYPASPSAQTPIEAFDAAGASLPIPSP